LKLIDDGEKAMSMDELKARFFPIAYEVEAGKIYQWCGCGKSKNQPLCDRDDCGSQALSYRALITETVCFCNCEETKNPPFCDGSHAKLLLEYLKKHKT
jgi:CDGSH-type Zn-finger protein